MKDKVILEEIGCRPSGEIVPNIADSDSGRKVKKKFRSYLEKLKYISFAIIKIVRF